MVHLSAVPRAPALRQPVRGAVLVAEVAVGALVVGEALGAGVPLQVRPRLVGDVRDQGGAGAAAPRLDVAGAAPPAAHAVQEVAGVVLRRGAALHLARLEARPRPGAVAAL